MPDSPSIIFTASERRYVLGESSSMHNVEVVTKASSMPSELARLVREITKPKAADE